ncbi:MAG: glycosyltransferase [Flavobacteriales bacterium]
MNQNKHILVLAEWFPHDEDPQLGVFIQKHCEVISRFARVTVVFVNGNDKQKEKIRIKEEFKGYRLIRASYRKSWFRPLHLHRYTMAMKKIRKMVGDVDLIHIQVVGRNYLAAKFIFKGIPFVITEHWSGYLREGTEPIIGTTYTREAFQNARAVSTVSAPLAKAIEGEFARKNIQIIPNLIEAADSNTRTKSATLRMIIVADLVDEIKNISGIIHALKELEPEENIHVEIVGDGKDRKDLEALCKSVLNKHISIHFSGRKTNHEVLKELAMADFMVMNSRTETFSMICAESIMAGTPAIATRCGGPESFVHSGNGILIGVDNPTELLEAIRFMIRNHNTYDKQKMRSEMNEKFGLDSITEKLKQFYSSVI